MTGLFSECYRDLSSSGGGDDMACSYVTPCVPHSKSIMTCQFYFQQIVDELSFAIRIFYMYITAKQRNRSSKSFCTKDVNDYSDYERPVFISPPKK